MYKKLIYRAALIPVIINKTDIDRSKMMFMIPSDQTYGGSDPQIAKGQIEPGEDAKTAAIREAQEELGLRPEHIQEIFDCGNWLGRTQLYAAIIDPDSQFDVPHFETEQVMWLTNDQFQRTGRDIHRALVKHVSDLIYMYTYDDK